MTDSQPIRLVLDTSAVLAYADGSVDVGETILEVVNEGGRFVLPAVCLAEATRRGGQGSASGVLLLTRHASAAVTTTPAGEWRPLAAWTRRLGRVDTAVALTDALRLDGYVLTAEPEAYGDQKDGPVIPI